MQKVCKSGLESSRSIIENNDLEKLFLKCTLKVTPIITITMATKTTKIAKRTAKAEKKTTKFIGMKEFRQNLAHYSKTSTKKNTRYIVLRKNVPVFEILPIDEKEYLAKKLEQELEEAMEDVRKGNIYTQEEVFRMFNIK